MGATHVVNSGNTDPLEFVNEHTENGVDVTFEVAGVGVTLAQSVKVTRQEAVLSLFQSLHTKLTLIQCY